MVGYSFPPVTVCETSESVITPRLVVATNRLCKEIVEEVAAGVASCVVHSLCIYNCISYD
jgi:hypothetical protein